MVPVIWSWHTAVEITIATAGYTSSSCTALVWGLSSPSLGFACSQGPCYFVGSQRSSPSWGAGSGECPDEMELEITIRAHHSSSIRCLALLHQLELWLWQCHQRSPGLQGILPTEAAIQEECTFTHFGYSCSRWLPVSLAAFEGVEDWPAHLLMQGGGNGAAESSSNIAGLVLRAADALSKVTGIVVETVGPPASGGSMGLGLGALLTSNSCNPCASPSKHCGHEM